jgi:hypothetical protein
VNTAPVANPALSPEEQQLAMIERHPLALGVGVLVVVLALVFLWRASAIGAGGLFGFLLMFAIVFLAYMFWTSPTSIGNRITAFKQSISPLTNSTALGTGVTKSAVPTGMTLKCPTGEVLTTTEVWIPGPDVGQADVPKIFFSAGTDFTTIESRAADHLKVWAPDLDNNGVETDVSTGYHRIAYYVRYASLTGPRTIHYAQCPHRD